MSCITMHNTTLYEYTNIYATPKIVSIARCSALSECWASVLVQLAVIILLDGAADICSAYVTMNHFGIFTACLVGWPGLWRIHICFA